MEDLSKNVDKVHVQLLEEENLAVKSLPENLRKKIRGWNLLFSRLEKNPQDEKLFRSVQKQSIEIADKIQDFIESDYDDNKPDDNKPDDNKPDDNKPDDNKPDDNKPDDNKPDDNKPDDNKPDDNKPDDNKPDDNKPDDKKPVDNKPKGFGSLPMAKKIQMKIKENGDGRISVSELKAIIGKEPDYPEQKVHNITLRKVFMASDYRIL